MRFTMNAKVQVPKTSSLNLEHGLRLSIPYAQGMDSYLREIVQRLNGITVTTAAVFGYTNSNGVTSAIMINAGVYSPNQLATYLSTALTSAENNGVSVSVTTVGHEEGCMFTVSATHTGTSQPWDPKPTFTVHFSAFSDFGWAPTTTTATAQITIAARMLGFTAGSTYQSKGGVLTSTTHSHHGSATDSLERCSRYQYNIIGDMLTRRAVISARQPAIGQVQVTTASSTVDGPVDSTTLSIASTTPIAVRVGDLVGLAIVANTGVSTDGITVNKITARVAEVSGLSVTLVANAEAVTRLNAAALTATATVQMTHAEPVAFAFQPYDLGVSLGFSTLSLCAQVQQAPSPWLLEDPSQSNMLLTVEPAGAITGASELCNYVVTGPSSSTKCLVMIKARRSEDALMYASGSIAEQPASVARIKRVKVSFRNMDGSLCNFSNASHTLSIIFRCDPTRSGGRVPLLT
jgi:hypothetical protein